MNQEKEREDKRKRDKGSKGRKEDASKREEVRVRR